MAIIRWQPFAEMETLRRQMDAMFEDMLTTKPDTVVAWKPAVELQDSDEYLVLRAEIPGVEGKDLDVQVTQKAVILAGEHRHEHKAENNGYYRSEFRYGKFQRVVHLPVAIQNEQVQAEFKDGILTLTLPKVVEAQRKVVKLNLAGEAVTNQPATEASQAEAHQAA